MDQRFKVVVVGDHDSGRRSLIRTFVEGGFPEFWMSDVQYPIGDIVIDEQEIELSIWHTAGQEDYPRLRPISYPDTDVVLICYDVMNPSRFNNVLKKWYPEMKHYCSGVPIILVGCKTDLRSDKFLEEGLWSLGLKPIKYTQGEEAARKISAAAYIDCSAKHNKNVDNVFREAAKQALMAKKVKDRCALL